MNGIGSAYESAPALERDLVDYVVDTRFSDLSPESVAAARRAVLWFVSTAIAGSNAPGSTAISDVAAQTFGDGPSTILGLRRSGSAEAAAFANACFAKAHEWEDKYWLNESRGFAMGFAIGATAVACAEQYGVSGQRLVEAVAVAVDVQARLMAAAAGADLAGLGPTRTGWNATYLFSNYGATIAAAKIMGLSRDQLVDALGLVHAQASGNFQGQMEGVLGIRLQAGFVVRNGILAARLAAAGISGAREFLSGRFGLYALHFPQNDVDLAQITRELDRAAKIERLGYKGHPCGVVAHPVLDAALSVRSVDVDSVREIRVEGSHALHIMVEPVDAKREPNNFIEAQFSLPWVVACAIADGGVRLRHFEAPALNDERLRGLARRVSTTMDPSLRTAVVEIELENGTTVRSDPVGAAHGHPDNPVTESEMVEVYGECVAHAQWDLPPDEAARGLRALLSIEEARDVSAALSHYR